MPAHRILVIEDEEMWIQLLLQWLSNAGYTQVEYAYTGHKGLEQAAQNPPDCILLDLELPDQSGMEVCQKLRAMPALSRVPVVLFTGHRREKVLGLHVGADYFVSKDEKPHELLATLEAVFRRKQMEEGTLSRGDLRLNTRERKVYWGERPALPLSPKMYSLFYALVERSPNPVSRYDLYRMVEGRENTPLSRALDVMLNRLRKALPEELGKRIVNVKGFGYAFLSQ